MRGIDIGLAVVSVVLSVLLYVYLTVFIMGGQAHAGQPGAARACHW
ncbi:MAG: hypothetical protein ACYC1C_10990 [Chloroflexota bacterium]